MAQDFQAAFGLNGADDTHISEVDIGGVSLAAIQKLNTQLNSQMQLKEAQIEDLKAQVAESRAETAELKSQAIAQSQAMAQLQQTFAARLTALERRSDDPTRIADLELPATQSVAMNWIVRFLH